MRRTILMLGAMAAAMALGSGMALAAAVVTTYKVVGSGESIQEAVNAADPGDTIVVRGVHREDVVIRKDGIKLRGIDGAVIEAPTGARADSPCSRTFGPEGICVLGDVDLETLEVNKRVSGVSISGFTLRGFEVGGKGDDKAYVIDVFGARGATVVDNRVMGNVAGAINSLGSVGTTIADNRIVGKTTDDDHNGINVEGIRGKAEALDTTVRGNVVEGYTDGIEDTLGVDTTISGNDVAGGAVSGIRLIRTRDTTVSGNDLAGNLLGILLEAPTGTEILSNDALRSGFAGIFLAGPRGANAKPVGARIVGNDLSGGDFGMFVRNAQRGTIAGNEVRHACAGMAFFSDFGPPSAGFGVKGNTVEDNTGRCPADEFRAAFSGIGIGLFGTRGMEVTGNDVSGNVPSMRTAASGGVVVGVDPIFDGTREPTGNAVTANDFGRNRPDIRWDGTGSGNDFTPNDCDASIPARLCD